MSTPKERPLVDPKVYELAEHFLRDGDPKPKPEQMENAIWALAKEIQDAVEDFTDPDLPHGICEFMK